MAQEQSRLPDGIIPTVAPSVERLEELTDEELYQCVRWWAIEGRASVGMQFWLDEQTRRRTQRVLDAIAEATAEDAQQVQRLTQLVAEGAEQNRQATNLTRRMFWLALANLVFASLAAVAAVVAAVAAIG